MRDYKIVVLGAGGVGKSSLTVQFVQGIYIDTYDPTIEDSYRKQIEIDGRACDLEILDTAGVAQFTAMRELYMKSGRGFLLVYAVNDENSLKELLALREQVLRIKDSTNVPMVLIGNKCDLADDERKLNPEDGIEVSEKWGRVPFYETSAMHRTNVDEAFIDVVRQIMRNEAIEHAQKQQQVSTNAKPNIRTSSSQSVPQLKNNSTKSLNGQDSFKITATTASSSSVTPKTLTPQQQQQQQNQRSQIQSKPLGKVNNPASNSKDGTKKKKKKSLCTIL